MDPDLFNKLAHKPIDGVKEVQGPVKGKNYKERLATSLNLRHSAGKLFAGADRAGEPQLLKAEIANSLALPEEEKAEVRSAVRREVKGLTKQEVETLAQQARKDFYQAVSKFAKFKREYDWSDESEKLRRQGELVELEKKHDLAFLRIDELNLLLLSMFGQKS